MKVTNTTENRNISFFCTYYTSSISEWETHKVGSPLDHSIETKRFSFHTEEEEAPFIHVQLPCEVVVDKVVIRLRDKYSDRITPLEVHGRSNDSEWIRLGEITTEKPLIHEIIFNKKLKDLRITKVGYGYLYLAGVDILVSNEDFHAIVKKLNKSSQQYLVYAPFYGLGGGLAVCASALGALSSGSIKKINILGSLSTLLSYPPSFKGNAEEIRRVREGLGKATSSIIFSDEKKYRTKKNISLWVEDGSLEHQNRPVALVTRDNISHYKHKNESLVKTSQRLYQKIVPSDIILEHYSKLLKKYNLNSDLFETSIGLHVRHGNGEKFYSSRMKRWGVKPPPMSKIEAAVKMALSGTPDINTILLCSDTKAVHHAVSKAFPHLRVIFISDNIQEVGAGCNHTDMVFDTQLFRKEICRIEDDVVSFAEALILSNCKKLCGGDSYFYRSVIGFSSIDAGDISYVTDYKRYIALPEIAKPIADADKNIDGTIALLNCLRKNKYHIDGLFITKVQENAAEVAYELTYFDSLIVSGSIKQLCKAIKSGDINTKLLEYRMYL